jgi:hypothetical protein
MRASQVGAPRESCMYRPFLYCLNLFLFDRRTRNFSLHYIIIRVFINVIDLYLYCTSRNPRTLFSSLSFPHVPGIDRISKAPRLRGLRILVWSFC